MSIVNLIGNMFNNDLMTSNMNLLLRDSGDDSCRFIHRSSNDVAYTLVKHNLFVMMLYFIIEKFLIIVLIFQQKIYYINNFPFPSLTKNPKLINATYLSLKKKEKKEEDIYATY